MVIFENINLSFIVIESYHKIVGKTILPIKLVLNLLKIILFQFIKYLKKIITNNI